ncbi:hypothetical protein SAMN03159338_3801 [Sphingomonas sp. NFR04]|nr:hypothetical protein SAMN03159338_3801 [Sphingomonas sp. NFR04]
MPDPLEPSCVLPLRPADAGHLPLAGEDQGLLSSRQRSARTNTRTRGGVSAQVCKRPELSCNSQKRV